MYESLSIICEYDADENKQSEVFKIKSCPPNVENLHNVKQVQFWVCFMFNLYSAT